MESHPVQLRIDSYTHPQRIHVLIRVALLCAIAAVGCSSVYWVLYLALPALVALRIIQTSSERYLTEDAPRIVRVLRWLASAYAYLWLLTDVLPTSARQPRRPGDRPRRPANPCLRVAANHLRAARAGAAAGACRWRSALLWLAGAVVILVRQTMPAAIADFITFTVRFQLRLAAYHLSLVDKVSVLREPASGRRRGRRRKVMNPGSTIADAMTGMPVATGASRPLSVARELMERYKIRHLPVVDLGRLVGIVSGPRPRSLAGPSGRRAPTPSPSRG